MIEFIILLIIFIILYNIIKIKVFLKLNIKYPDLILKNAIFNICIMLLFIFSFKFILEYFNINSFLFFIAFLSITVIQILLIKIKKILKKNLF